MVIDQVFRNIQRQAPPQYPQNGIALDSSVKTCDITSYVDNVTFFEYVICR